jgi:hypothetical protein
MKGKYLFLIYAKDPPKQFTGILGTIDFHIIQLLLAGGKYLIEESYSEKDPIAWYTGILEQQGIYVIQGKQQQFKGQIIIWMEVDTLRTNIQEFTSWKELDPSDIESLAWRSFYYTCEAGTSKECLGLAVVAREFPLQPTKNPIVLQHVFDAMITSINKK